MQTAQLGTPEIAAANCAPGWRRASAQFQRPDRRLVVQAIRLAERHGRTPIRPLRRVTRAGVFASSRLNRTNTLTSTSLESAFWLPLVLAFLTFLP